MRSQLAAVPLWCISLSLACGEQGPGKEAMLASPPSPHGQPNRSPGALDGETRTTPELPGESPVLYPIDPRVHVRDPGQDPGRPGSVHAAVPSAVAHAHHAALALAGPGAALPVTGAAIAAVIASQGRASGVPAAVAAAIYLHAADAGEREAERQRLLAGARGPGDGRQLPSIGLRVADLRSQLRRCTAETARAARDCCAALAVPWFFLAEAASLDPVAQQQLQEMGREDTLYEALPERTLAGAAGTAGQPFHHRNLRAWLAVCTPVVRAAPESLAALHARWGTPGEPGWTAELHPISMAKQGPRRIHRRGPVSLAETLDEQCGVRETEVVEVRPDGVLEFWVFDAGGRRRDHGLFPAGRGVDAPKYAPDACMGCHYTLDTREFVVRAPSYRVLGLGLRRSGDQPQWFDGQHCARPGETVVWHERP